MVTIWLGAFVHSKVILGFEFFFRSIPTEQSQAQPLIDEVTRCLSEPHSRVDQIKLHSHVLLMMMLNHRHTTCHHQFPNPAISPSIAYTARRVVIIDCCQWDALSTIKIPLSNPNTPHDTVCATTPVRCHTAISIFTNERSPTLHLIIEGDHCLHHIVHPLRSVSITTALV
ncbi:uncharacterized protein HKW66_Vig0010280 [Vigna angularis]|uniref:Uncharacterized protein n=1 Tax=Phaseolus angularis TaxID=3914 RepID=A0A8T0LIF1_PHAAN|nr:uncharacterized protein HKW66_Vig0010280 [Vigna angularis]